MKTYKNKTIKVHDKTFCDCCGKQCTDDFYNENEYATLEASWGYNSGRDGERFDIHLCENCFGDVLGFLKDKRFSYFGAEPNKEWGIAKDDPFKGSKYM